MLFVVLLFVTASAQHYSYLETTFSSWKFVFGPGKVPSRYRQVTPANVYNKDVAYGFEPCPNIVCFNRNTSDVLRTDFCTSDQPFYFSVALPEGNYSVRITFGDVTSDTVTTVKAELRRLMVERVETAPGKFVTRKIAVNIRTPAISGGAEVRLKDREKTTEAWAWDEKLTLEFNGPHPTICRLEIARADQIPTLY